jgi:hypothetical protein
MRDRTSEANSKDLTGMRFGRLFAVNRVPFGHITPAGQELVQYQCLCDCGNFCDVLAMNLVSGNTQSCGCIGNSRGEAYITKYFDEKQIRNQRQYKFDDLISNKGAPLKFDFGLFGLDGNLICLVEYNGEQHYYPVDRRTWFGKLQREETDELKRNYCEKNHIKLFEIRFDDDLYEKLSEVEQYYMKSVA